MFKNIEFIYFSKNTFSFFRKTYYGRSCDLPTAQGRLFMAAVPPSVVPPSFVALTWRNHGRRHTKAQQKYWGLNKANIWVCGYGLGLPDCARQGGMWATLNRFCSQIHAVGQVRARAGGGGFSALVVGGGGAHSPMEDFENTARASAPWNERSPSPPASIFWNG